MSAPWIGLRRVLRIATRRRAELDVAAEIEFHLDSRTRDLIALGHDATDARAAAEREFGDVAETRSMLSAVVRRRQQRVRRADWWEALGQDMKFGARALRRSPLFTMMVVLVLALGLGANAAVFGLVDRIFLQPPAGVQTPSAVRRLYYYRPSDEIRALAPANSVYEVAMYPEYAAVREAASRDALFGTYVRPDSVEVHVGSATAPMMLSYANRGYFDVLGLRPALGRFFAPDEDRADAAPSVAVISDALWIRQFGAIRDVIGQRLAIGDRVYTIVGVTPPHFSGVDLDRAEVWIPLGAIRTPPFFSRPWYQGGLGVFRVIARVSSDDAARHITAVATSAYRRARSSFGIVDTTSRVLTGPVVAALGPADRRQAESISLRLSGVSFALLLIACANAANMLLVRATRRRRELAIRRALGISSRRLMWQLTLEGLLLSTIAGIVAACVAVWGSSALRMLLMPDIRWADARGDARLLMFVAIASVVTGPAAAFAPALRASRGDLSEALKTNSPAGRRRPAWMRSGLLVGQAALSIVLLIGAGLFVGSLRNVSAIDLGFDARGLVTVTARFRDPARKAEVAPALDAVAAQLAALPSVQQVATALVGPMHGAYVMDLYIPGRDSVPAIDGTRPFGIPASPNYFRTTGTRLLRGRLFDSTNRGSTPNVVVINATMARTVWAGDSAIGKCVKILDRSAPCATVVGIVEDTHVLDIIEKQRFMQVYVPLAQSAALEADRFGAWNRVLIVRTRDRAEQDVIAIARHATLRLLPNVDVIRVDDMRQVLDPALRPWRLDAILFGLLAALAAGVAAVGVYGVVAFSASQRTHELGVRIAVGAQRSDIVGLIVGDALRVVTLGILAGLALAIVLGRLVESLLYGLSPRNPVVLAGACAVIAAMGAFAAFWPALRASRLDPAYSLRAE
jgi:predicted permease